MGGDGGKLGVRVDSRTGRAPVERPDGAAGVHHGLGPLPSALVARPSLRDGAKQAQSVVLDIARALFIGGLQSKRHLRAQRKVLCRIAESPAKNMR